MRFKNDTLKSYLDGRCFSLTQMRQAVTSVSCEKEFRASTECTVSNSMCVCATLAEVVSSGN